MRTLLREFKGREVIVWTDNDTTSTSGTLVDVEDDGSVLLRDVDGSDGGTLEFIDTGMISSVIILAPAEPTKEPTP